MNSLASFQSISKEDLNYYLPRSLIEVLEDRDSCYSSPLSGKINQHIDDYFQIPSPNFTPSPQIPPLESRLHSYLLKKKSTEETAKPCNLSKYFDEANIENEIEIALKSIPHRVKIFEFLDENGFFQHVEDVIQEHENSIKPKLNAQALSFIPDFEKENICPQTSMKKREIKLNNRNY